MEPYLINPDSQHPEALRLFDQFEIFRTAYKLIQNQPIHAFFIVPKKLPPGPRPLLVRFHGGGFVEGEADASIRPFFLELALKHGAVILTPDYRLRPEHEFHEGVEDVESFWQWVENGSAQNILNTSLPDITIDTANLMVAGESAGGHFVALSGLLRLTKLPIRVLFMQYPALDLASIAGVEGVAEEMRMVGLWAEHVPYSEVEDHLNGIEKGTLCTRAAFGSRMRLLAASVQAGKFCDLDKVGERLDPMRALENAETLPPILLYHSKDDESVPWQHTEAWATKLRRLQPDVPLYLTYQKGEHVFDKDDTMATPWLKEPLEFVERYWPA